MHFKLQKPKPITNPQRVFKLKGLQPSTLRRLILTYQVIFFKGTFPKTGYHSRAELKAPEFDHQYAYAHTKKINMCL